MDATVETEDTILIKTQIALMKKEIQRKQESLESIPADFSEFDHPPITAREREQNAQYARDRNAYRHEIGMLESILAMKEKDLKEFQS